jgi:hypothetical protein
MRRPSQAIRPRRGRPRKFTGPSRAITLTLPLDVVEALGAIDADLSRAIVRLTQPELAKRPHPSAELVVFGKRAVIVVNPTRTLEDRTGVELVPLPDGRALISFDQATTIPGLELGIEDAVDDRRLSAEDRAVFEAVLNILKTARRSGDVGVLQRNIIVLESRRHPKISSGRPRRQSRKPAA